VRLRDYTLPKGYACKRTRPLDLTRVAAIIRETAEIEVMPRFRALKPGDVREKKPGDFVTVADEASEAMLTARLPDLLPGSVVVGEEAVAHDAAVLKRLEGDAPVWILDPIDGTGNFVHGRERFGMIVSLVQAGQVLAGWIYEPIADIMVLAERGSGAWSAGERLSIDGVAADAKPQGAAYGKTSRGAMRNPVPNASLLAESGLFGAIENHQCGATEYVALALRAIQFSLHSRSLPWDHAAGMLIAEEAGGVARFLDGSAYDARLLDLNVLAAASQDIFDAVQATLRADPPIKA
jgi:fructose-1,6-bisphosphatase/inositol monophosphatase family enzyme